MFKKPEWYVTPQEFADLVVETMEELKYFNANEFAHPEDINNSFVVVSEALAKGMSYAGQRVFNSQKKVAKEAEDYKQAMMKPSFTKAHALPEDDEIAPVNFNTLINSYKNTL